MRHDWIIDVLSDLKAYAMAHGMIALAVKTEEALRVAREEVAVAPDAADPQDAQAGKPKSH